MKSLTHIIVCSAAFALTAQGAIVFSDDFETPDVVSTYTVANTSQTASSNWVRATTGFNASRNGIIDEAENGGANFTDPTGSQAYGLRYTNSGLTTASGVLGSLAVGQTITVSFDVVTDGFNGGTPFDATLVTFNGGTRNDMSGDYTAGTTSVLARLTGNSTGSYQTVQFSYTVGDDVLDADGATTAATDTTFNSIVLGHDIAIRFDGATSAANIDNVSVSIVPEPSAALLGVLGSLLLLRRRRA